MWGAIGGVVFGVCGWLLAKLLFEPVKEIIDLRREAQECFIVYGDLSKDAHPDERRMAVDAFRRGGAGIVSRAIAAYPWVNFCLTRFSVDIHSAGELLLGVARNTQFQGFSHANLSAEATLIRTCLRLPSVGQPPIIRALAENATRPAV